MEIMAVQCSYRLILGVVARVIGLLHMLQDDVHHPQDIIECAWVLRDPGDRGHTKILQDLGHIPHLGCQLAELDDAVNLGVSKNPSKLDKLHLLVVIILGVEPPGLSLHQRRYA
jgi:hypothetical protein